MSFHGDGEPNEFEAQRVLAADVIVHEEFLDAPTFAEKNGMAVETAGNVLTAHTTPDMLGRLFDLSKPALGVGYHYFVNDDTVDSFFDGITSSYDGPVVSPRISWSSMSRPTRCDIDGRNRPASLDATPTEFGRTRTGTRTAQLGRYVASTRLSEPQLRSLGS